MSATQRLPSIREMLGPQKESINLFPRSLPSQPANMEFSKNWNQPPDVLPRYTQHSHLLPEMDSLLSAGSKRHFIESAPTLQKRSFPQDDLRVAPQYFDREPSYYSVTNQPQPYATQSFDCTDSLSSRLLSSISAPPPKAPINSGPPRHSDGSSYRPSLPSTESPAHFSREGDSMETVQEKLRLRKQHLMGQLAHIEPCTMTSGTLIPTNYLGPNSMNRRIPPAPVVEQQQFWDYVQQQEFQDSPQNFQQHQFQSQVHKQINPHPQPQPHHQQLQSYQQQYHHNPQQLLQQIPQQISQQQLQPALLTPVTKPQSPAQPRRRRTPNLQEGSKHSQCVGVSQKKNEQCRNAALMDYIGPRPLHCAEHIHLDETSLYQKCATVVELDYRHKYCKEVVLKEFGVCFKHLPSHLETTPEFCVLSGRPAFKKSLHLLSRARDLRMRHFPHQNVCSKNPF